VTDTTAFAAAAATSGTAPAAPSGKGLGARLAGVIFSPRATYVDVAAFPRVLGALVVVLVLSIGASMVFFSTEVGKNALMDQQERTLQNFGVRMNDARYAQMQARMQGSSTVYFTAAGQLVALPLLAVVIAGILIAVFNAVMGGNATFKQVFAIVIHSQVLGALGALFMYPIMYAKESLSSPTNLMVFMPFLDEGSFLARLLGAIDLFRIWWIVNLAIGMGVLYKKRTTPIATTMLVLYAVIGLIIAAIGVAFSGA
jgi:hypothetical protein